MTLLQSLKYTPAELGFGTSGLRGLVTDMTDLEVYINVCGFVAYLLAEKLIQPGNAISLAGDLRDSTPRIMAVTAQAITDSGLQVENCGKIPTPAVAVWAMTKNQASIMVTGSHIPADRNGIKFNKPEGEVLKGDEQAIKQFVAKTRAEQYSLHSDTSLFNELGELKNAQILQEENLEAEEFYINRFLDFFDSRLLLGKKIVVYQHSAVGRDIFCEILEGLGAEVVATMRSDIFVPIDTENVTPKDKVLFKKLITDNPGTFALVSTDGDSDRPFLIDENGEFYRGDILGAVVAEHLKARAAAIPISASDAVDEYLEDILELTKTRIGSPYVIDAMKHALDAGLTPTVGWEVNGGFLTGSAISVKGKTISALPTRDAFFPIIVALAKAVEAKQKVSEVFSLLPKRFTDAGLIDNFPQESSKKIIAALSAITAKDLVAQVATSEQGFGTAIDINTLDGVRIVFDTGDILHIRPSGNAPQLRVYSVADTQGRAEAIVDDGIADPGGLVRRLEQIAT